MISIRTFLTGLHHVCDIHTLLLRHEAEHGEDGESCDEAGAAVEETQSEAVPETQTHACSLLSTRSGCEGITCTDAPDLTKTIITNISNKAEIE